MTDPDRIERAARALARADFPDYGEDELAVFWAASGRYRTAQRKAARAVLAAAYPEIHANPPSHWLAPWEATIKMGDVEWWTMERSGDVWRVWRDSYLSEQSDKDTT